jgi:hypothetical protein
MGAVRGLLDLCNKAAVASVPFRAWRPGGSGLRSWSLQVLLQESVAGGLYGLSILVGSA